jgi:hypothetical protein
MAPSLKLLNVRIVDTSLGRPVLRATDISTNAIFRLVDSDLK